MKWLLCRWERNGYDDSDFYAGGFDDVAGKLESQEEGSTRYPGGNPVDWRPITEAPEAVKVALARCIVESWASAKAADDRERVERPCPVERGEVLRLVRDVRNRESGLLPAGLTGEVFWSGSYGKFYRNGYNRPGPSNTRVGLAVTDGPEALRGKRVFVSLEACRRNREPLTLGECRQRAALEAARGWGQVDPARWFGGAWCSLTFCTDFRLWAEKVLSEGAPQEVARA